MPTKPASEKTSDQTPAQPLPVWQRLWHNWIKPIGIVVVVLGTFRSAIADWNDVPSGSMQPTIEIGDRVIVNKLAYGLHVPFSGPKIAIPLTGIEFSNPLRDLPSLDWSQPKRGDIITFWSPEPDTSRAGINGTRLIKRVVALAGDRILWTADGTLIITTPDGQRYEATYDQRRDITISGRDERGRAYRFAGMQLDEQIDGQQRTIQRLMGRGPLRPFPEPDSAIADEDGYLIPEGYLWAMGDNRDLSRDCRVIGPVPLNLVTGRAVAIAFSHDGWAIRWSRLFNGLD
ncbi:MAG: signal peptidase I [Phycisphaeraceae bacterium]|nr:signal peptidase I [Phycisphaeraceae bacterium]